MKHRDILEAIYVQLQKIGKYRPAVNILKVKAHSGVQGNEKADALAKAASEGNPVLVEAETRGADYHHTRYWPTLVVTNEQGHAHP